jgi:hypothetical protein
MTNALTTYTIHEAPSVTHTTTDADHAEEAARAGLRVTAVTEGGGA